jgi:hypothetical protein
MQFAVESHRITSNQIESQVLSNCLLIDSLLWKSSNHWFSTVDFQDWSSIIDSLLWKSRCCGRSHWCRTSRIAFEDPKMHSMSSQGLFDRKSWSFLIDSLLWFFQSILYCGLLWARTHTHARSRTCTQRRTQDSNFRIQIWSRNLGGKIGSRT